MIISEVTNCNSSIFLYLPSRALLSSRFSQRTKLAIDRRITSLGLSHLNIKLINNYAIWNHLKLACKSARNIIVLHSDDLKEQFSMIICSMGNASNLNRLMRLKVASPYFNSFKSDDRQVLTGNLSRLHLVPVKKIEDKFIPELPDSHFKHLTSKELAKLPPSQIRRLSSTQINIYLKFIKKNYSHHLEKKLSFLTPAQVKTLNDEFISKLPELQLNNLSENQFIKIAPKQIKTLSTSQIHIFLKLIKRDCTDLLVHNLSHLTPIQIKKLKDEFLSEIPDSQFKHITPEQFTKLAPSQIQKFGSTEINNFLKLIKRKYNLKLSYILAFLSPAQIKSIDNRFISEIPVSQFEHLTPEQLIKLPPSQIQRLGQAPTNSFLKLIKRTYTLKLSHILAILSPTQIKHINDRFISQLPISQFEHLTPEQFAKLSVDQIRMIPNYLSDVYSDSQIRSIPSTWHAKGIQIELFRRLGPKQTNDFLKFTKSTSIDKFMLKIDSLHPRQVAGLDLEFIDNLSVFQFKHLSAEQFAVLTPDQIRKITDSMAHVFSDDQINAIPDTWYVQGMCTELYRRLNTIQINNFLTFIERDYPTKLTINLNLLSAAQVKSLDAKFISKLPLSQFEHLSAEQFAILTPDQIRIIPDLIAHVFSDDQVDAIPDTWYMQGMCTRLYKRLNAIQINNFLTFIERFYPTQFTINLNLLNEAQLKSLDAKFISKLHVYQYEFLSLKQIAKLTPEQINKIPDAMVHVFSNVQIDAIPDTWYMTGMCTRLYKRLNPKQIHNFLKFIKINYNHALLDNLKLLGALQVRKLDNEFLSDLPDSHYSNLSEEQIVFLLNSLDINIVKRISEFYSMRDDLDINSPLSMHVNIKYIESHPDLDDIKNPFVIYQKIQKSQAEDVVKITAPIITLGETTYKLDLTSITDAGKKISKKWTFSELEATLGAPALKKEEIETWFRSLDAREDQINAASGLRTLDELEAVLCRQSSNWLISGPPYAIVSEQVLQFNVCIRTLLKKAIDTPRNGESQVSDEELDLLKFANVFIQCSGGRVEQLRTIYNHLKPIFLPQFQDRAVSVSVSLSVLLDLYRTTVHDYLKGTNYVNPHESEYVLNMIGLRIGLLNQTIVYDPATQSLSDDLAAKSLQQLIDDVLQSPTFFESFIENVKQKLCTILPEGPSHEDIFTGEETSRIFDNKLDSGGYSYAMALLDIPDDTPYVTRIGAIRALEAVGILKEIFPDEDTTYISLPPNALYEPV